MQSTKIVMYYDSACCNIHYYDLVRLFSSNKSVIECKAFFGAQQVIVHRRSWRTASRLLCGSICMGTKKGNQKDLDQHSIRLDIIMNVRLIHRGAGKVKELL